MNYTSPSQGEGSCPAPVQAVTAAPMPLARPKAGLSLIERDRMRSTSCHIATAGLRLRDLVQVYNMPGRDCLYGKVGALSHELDAGGPLDATNILPAGSVRNTDTTDSRGRPVVTVSEIPR